jgi:hypothetical protein
VPDLPAPTSLPRPRGPLRAPVRWLLTPDVFGYLKQALLHAFYRGQLDPRDWMRIEDGHAHVEDASPGAGRERALAAAPIVAPASGELWFDYAADTGDGGVAMYTVAYLCQAHLAVDDGIGRDHAELIGKRVLVPPTGPGADVDRAALPLPRGQFLFIGGDTAYHVANEDTIAARVQVPFTRAADDLARVQPAHVPRRLYGIPGNHDYYDQLIGFGRMFRNPVTVEGRPGPGGRLPHLPIPNLTRVQEASYVAIELPWDWQLWGLDVNAWLDARQEWYFRSLPLPKKLIVATPSPPIVHHAIAVDRAHRDAFARLALPPLFEGGQPAPGSCRLDISGDTHHYARYEPEKPIVPATTAVGLGKVAPQPAPAPYLAVVSGGGGAFHHPSFVHHSDIEPQASYPTEAVSRRAVARQLFNPVQLFNGGLIWIIPFLLAAFLGTGATRSAGTAWLGDHVLAWFGITGEQPLGSDVTRAIGARAPGELIASLRYLAFGAGALLLFLLALQVRGVRFSAAQRSQPGLLDRALGSPDDPPRRRLATWLVLIGAVLPFISPFFIQAPLADALWFDGWWLFVIVFALATSLGLGIIGGAKHRPLGRAGFIALGLVHGLVQVVTPFVITRVALVTWWLAPAMLVILGIGALAGRAALTRGSSPTALGAIALTAWLLSMLVVFLGARGVAVYPAGTLAWLLVIALGAVVAITASILHLGWYLAIAAAGGGHSNEVGGAARLEDYRQFIRFRLTPDRLTGYVIACDRPQATGAALRPYIVDVFELGARPIPPP